MGVEQPVGLAPVRLGERLAGGERREHERQPDPEEAQHDPEHERGDHQRARDADRERAGDGREALARDLQPAAQVQPLRLDGDAHPLARDAHPLASTVTSPVLESAWIWNGASSAAITPRTLRSPPSESASSW